MGRVGRPSASLSTLATLVVLVMAVVLIVGAILVSQATATLDKQRGRSAAADGVTESAQALLMALQEAEDGQSSYLLTGRPEYLSPYWVAVARMRSNLIQLDSVAEDEAWLMPEVQTLRALGERRLSELERSIAAADTSGIAAARAIVITNDSHATMQAARTVIDRIETRAAMERDSRGAAAARSERRLFLGILGTAIAGVLLLGTASLALLVGRERLLRAQGAVRQQSARWQGTVENLRDGVAVFDAQDRLVLWNARMLPIAGLPAELAQPGTPFARFVAATAHWVPPPLDEDPVRVEGMTAEIRCDGRVLEVSRNAMPGGGHMLAVGDVTRRAQTEAIARQSQKMEVLGQLTGGVAHDFNNLLQIVSANLELAGDRNADESTLRARLAGAMEGVERGARLTRHLLAFARRQPLAPKALDAGRLLTGLSGMLRGALGSAVALDMVIANGLWSLRADAQQLENALLNLAINSRDAMAGQTRPARLTIEAYNSGQDENDTAESADVTPGQYVIIAVSDNGHGMTPEQITRAIEPFYTTKPEGQGTGLGLSMVYGFAKQSGGHLTLHSEVGQGTTARLYIPRTIVVPQPPDSQADDAPRAKGETVLVVDDEPSVRSSTAQTLRGLGYTVAEAADAEAAMRLIEKGLRPDLLFTDMMMPGALTAQALAEQALAKIPGLAVVFTSGNAENAMVRNGPLAPHAHLVSKPWRTGDLARRLRAALTEAQILAGTEAPAASARRRILLVEDEDLVRTITADMLAELGYEVLEAGSADEAQPLLAGIDLLIADVGLRGTTDGLSLAAMARTAVPDLPVIVASGLPGPAIGAEAYTWLSKPYDDRALRAALAKAMDAAG